MSRHYGRAQFLKDAAWMGLPPEATFSRAELRRRRDRLMSVHHPDRGGRVEKAARINAVYTRMILWLDNHGAGDAERQGVGAGADARAEGGSLYKSSLSAVVHAGAAQICAVALIALATLAAFRGSKKP